MGTYKKSIAILGTAVVMAYIHSTGRLPLGFETTPLLSQGKSGTTR